MVIFSPELDSDLVLFLCATIFELLVIIVPKALKHRGIISSHFARKIIHALAGLAVFIAPYMNYPILAVLLSGASVIMTRKSAEKSKTKMLRELFEAIGEDEEIQVGYLQGPFAYSIAITSLTLIFIFFPTKYYFPIAGILIMMYADTMASIIGRKWGKHSINISWVGSKRTIEGSLAFFFTALLCSFLSFLFFGRLLPGHSMILNDWQIIILSIVLSLVATILEIISPSKYDDLIVPLCAVVLISVFALLIGAW
jgi:phytol kinase